MAYFFISFVELHR